MGIIQPILWLALAGKSNEHWQSFQPLIASDANLSPALTPSQLQGLGAYFAGFQHSHAATLEQQITSRFMAMSMVAFTVVFTTAFVGMSVVWDKRLGFMNKVFSTPVSSSVIILSKVFLQAYEQCSKQP